jgi:hypothetical protein
MSSHQIDPPLRIGAAPDFYIRSGEDARRFLREQGPRHGNEWEALLEQLETAATAIQLNEAVAVFRRWLQSEQLLVPLGPDVAASDLSEGTTGDVLSGETPSSPRIPSTDLRRG